MVPLKLGHRPHVLDTKSNTHRVLASGQVRSPLVPVSSKRVCRRKLAALQLEDAPPFEEVKKQAEAALAQATNFLPALDESEHEIADLQRNARDTTERAEEADRRLAELGPRVEAALSEARKVTAELKTQHEEISTTDLHLLAETLLTQWSQEARPDSLQVPVEEEVGISGIADAVLIAHRALVVIGGRKYVVIAIVVGERFPEGALDGTVMHWGCSGSGGGKWLPPPSGWHTIPPISRPAGRAWQTTLGAYSPILQASPVTSETAHALVLQVPLEGILAKGGALSFVLKRPQGVHPEWLQSARNQDFRISIEEVGKRNAGEKPTSGDAAQFGRERPEGGVEGWVKREGEAPAPAADGQSGPFSQQYQAAAAFLQSVASRAEQKGTKLESEDLEQSYRAAEGLLAEAKQLMQDIDRAKEDAGKLRQEADSARGKLEEAERRAGQLRADSESAVLLARRAAAMLRGKEQEVGLPELQAAAQARLASWLSWVDSRKNMETGAEFGGSQEAAEVSNFRLYGLDGWLSASATLAEEGGQKYAVVSMAASESFPDGTLEGVVAHWGVAGHDQRGAWEPPPKGWVSEPEESHSAGGATESPLERMDIPGEESLHAYALTLQLPLEGALKRGGIKLVLRTQAGQWLACSYQGSHSDIFINLEELAADAGSRTVAPAESAAETK